MRGSGTRKKYEDVLSIFEIKKNKKHNEDGRKKQNNRDDYTHGFPIERIKV